MRNVRIAAAASAILAGCAQVPSTAPESVQETTAPAASEVREQARSEPPARAEPLPNQELTSQILYQLLLAEIAGQRGDLALSAAAYLDLAKKTRDPRIARRAAEVAHFGRQNDAAIEAATLWLDIDPASQPARQMLVGLLAQTGRYAEMQPHLARMLSDNPEGAGATIQRVGRMLARNPDRRAVLAAVDSFTQPYLNVPEARMLRAQTAFSAGEQERALKEIDAALELQPDSEQAILIKAQMLQQDAPAKALEFLRTFLQRYPNARDVRLQYARALVGEKRYEEARVEFQRLLVDFPDNNDVLFAVGALSFQLNDYVAAEKSFRKLIDNEYPDAGSIRLYLGQISENQKRLDDALGWYASVPQGEQYVAAQIRYAQVLAQQGKLDDARRSLQQASAANNRERVQLTLAEAQILRDGGRVEEAFEVLDRALVAQPNQPDLLYETGLLAERLGRADVSESYLRKLIHVKPDYAHAYNALGYSLADRNERLDEALSLISKALQLSPEDPFIMDSMGWVLFRRGDFKAALDYLTRAYALRPDPEIAAHLGEVLWVMGRRDEAAKTWKEAAKVNPGNEVLSGAIKRFLQ
jgi:tetratricopeptide (TPR) repeat protein